MSFWEAYTHVEKSVNGNLFKKAKLEIQAIKKGLYKSSSWSSSLFSMIGGT